MNETFKNTISYDKTVPVLIVGGGLIGLSTSLFLSWQGISSLLVERHPGTAIHARAAGFTPRTMEMFRSVGIEGAIRQVESHFSRDSNVPLVESLVAQRRAVPLLRMCWSRCCERGPNSSVGLYASGPNWWPSSRMKMASRPRFASGPAGARAQFVPSFWWRLTAAIAGFVNSLALASMEQQACFMPSV
jgi:hypothetical protein